MKRLISGRSMALGVCMGLFSYGSVFGNEVIVSFAREIDEDIS